MFPANDGEEALDILRKELIHLVLTDLKMPKMDGVELLKVAKTIRPEVEVILITGYGTVDTAVTAMKDGAFDYIQKPFKPREILKLVRKAMEKQSLVLENRMLQERIKDFQKFEKIVGRSPAMKKVLEIVAQVAPSSATVLIQGESGTGKEVIAQAIHDLSPRVNQPFHQGKLCGPARDPAGGGIIRVRTGGFYRGHCPQGREVRTGQWRNPFSGRNRGSQPDRTG